MTDETISTGWSSGTMVLIGVVFFLILFAFLGRGFGGFNNNGWNNGFNGWNGGSGFPYAFDSAGPGHASNCEVERQSLINTATTQHLIETTSRDSREQLSAQMNNWRYEQLSSQLFDAKLNSVMMQNANNLALAEKNSTIERLQLANSVTSQFNQLNSKIDNVACRMAKAPELATLSAACPSASVVSYNGYGYNNGCGCGNAFV